MEPKSLVANYLRFYLFVAAAGAIIAVLKVAVGYTSDLNDPAIRFSVLVGMFLLALLYHNIADTAWKLAIGFVEIAAALYSNYYQLEKLASATTREAVYDRLAFLVGGIILLSKGINDVAKGQYLQKNFRPLSDDSHSGR